MLRNRLLSLCAVLLCLLALSVVAPVPAWGQGTATNTGTMIGSVFDNSGAFVPGATVAITENTTSSTRTTTTDKSGRFVFADVDPGSYTVKVTKTGFSSTVVSDQVVQIGTTLTENVQLKLGSVSTTVEVKEVPGAELQTMNATVGTTLSGDIIIMLPNLTRDASTLAIFQPGQNINGNTGGVASDQNSFQLDGGYATDDMSGDNNTYITSFSGDTAGGAGKEHSAGFAQAPSAVVPVPVASVEEFKISTANQTADFNGGGGSQMQLVTKRGTNAFHGSAYEYYLDSTFAGANTWDNNHTGKPQASSHYSRFGGDAGGKIPGVNVLGGGWYLFGLYEGFRFPQSSVFERNFPLPSLAAGILHLNGQTINLNPTATVDPGCGAAVGCKLSAQGYNQVGQSVPTTACPSGPCDPRGLGLNPVVSTLWSTYLPLPLDCGHGDGINYCGYKGNISTPQTSNFGVARIDHDFSSKYHFNGTYHYYRLIKTVTDQWDIGGFFPGDTKGQYSAIRNKPQIPWIYTTGLTTDFSSNVTNNVRFSFTRNFWAYQDPSGVPNVAGYPAALEIGGEFSGSGSSPVFIPYNTNNQNVRTRFWDGKDMLIGDDVSWLKGNHLIQFGGSWLRNDDIHHRNDNGESINTYEQYLVGDGNGTSLSSLGIDMTGFVPTGVKANKYGNLYSMVLGMVDESQSLYSRSVGSLTNGLPLNPRTSCAITGLAPTAGCISSPAITDESIIPTYNVYLGDSWHLKPNFTLNYGLGYTIQMPPYSTNGGYQTVMVDQSDHLIYAQNYLNSVQQAALQGNTFAPLLGFATVRNVYNHTKYPYDPYYDGLSPRVGFAWNFRPDTVVRGGFARIFGRINGVNPILVPLLTPGLLQPVTCGGPNPATGGCGGTPASVFRVGVDGVNAPLPPPSANLPQPWFPGFNDVATGSGETFDPNFHPDRSDEFTLSIQHQFGPKILAEVGYIGRRIRNLGQYYSLTAVPYMMNLGGQRFANAWKNLMVATNYGSNIPSSKDPGYVPYLNALQAQPFLESGLGGATSAFCSAGGFTSCTAAFIDATNGSGLMAADDPFDAWGNNGIPWTFGRTFTSDPVNSPFGINGQSPSILTTISNGYGNYHAGYLQLTTQDYRGLTMKANFQMA